MAAIDGLIDMVGCIGAWYVLDVDPTGGGQQERMRTRVLAAERELRAAASDDSRLAACRDVA